MERKCSESVLETGKHKQIEIQTEHLVNQTELRVNEKDQKENFEKIEAEFQQISTEHEVDVTEKDLNDLAEEIRPYTAEAMKIDMAPWIKGYITDMDELYTELSLEKLETTSSISDSQILDSYKDLFENRREQRGNAENHSTNRTGPLAEGWRQLKLSLTSISVLLSTFFRFCLPDHFMDEKVKTKEMRGQKVLVKGEEGLGKTTMVKKMAWDWAKGLFTAFSIVLFVSLKLVRPGDTIENIIIQQNPSLENLNLQEKNLQKILESFGSRCLLLLDGLDEHKLGSNDDVLKVIEGRKLSSCNILLTARPLSSTHVEQYFHRIILVKGFSEEQTTKFIANVSKTEELAAAVSEFNSQHFLRGHSSYTCPILILFVCILVNSGEIDLTRKHIPLGEIYTSLVRCLYRRFVIRKDIHFSKAEFVDVMQSVGKLAWEVLQSGTSWFLLSEVIHIVGQDAFEYGLFTGHEDFRLLDEAKKICITFPHDSILQFLASFYFTSLLDNGESIESLLGSDSVKPVFMTNPLFLTFCLWFLADECHENYFSFPNRNQAYDSLVSSTVKNINFMQVDLTEMALRFPILQFPLCADNRMEDQLVLKFLHEVFARCENIKELHLNRDYPMNWLLDLLSNKGISVKVTVNEGNKVSTKHISLNTDTSQSELALIDQTKDEPPPSNTRPYLGLKKHLSKSLQRDINKVRLDLPTFMQHFQKLKTLHHYLVKNGLIIAQSQIEKSPYLTEISFVELEIDESLLIALAKAVEMNYLPSLSSLSFERCGEGLKGNLSVLFEHKWPTLAHLNLRGCRLDENDLMIFPSDVLPKLSLLALSLGEKLTSKPHIWDLKAVRFLKFQTITKLWLDDIKNEEYLTVATQLNKGTLPNLNDLGISMVNVRHYQTQKELNEMPPPSLNLASLADLTLQRFVRSPKHLNCEPTTYLTLQKLDISHSSGMTGNLSRLLSKEFSSLNNLILSDCGLNAQDLLSLAQAKNKGRLPQLKHLDISQNLDLVGKLESLFQHGEQWHQLLTLNTQQQTLSHKDFQVLVSNMQSSLIQDLKFSAQRADELYKDKWPHLRDLHMCCPLDLSVHVAILEPLPGAVEKELFQNLSNITLSPVYVHKQLPCNTTNMYLDPAKTKDTLTTHLFKKTQEMLKAVKAGSLTEELAIDNLTVLVFDMLRAIADPDVVSNTEFQSMLHSMIQITFQAMESSQPLDWEALSKVARAYCEAVTNADSKHCEVNSAVVSLVTDMKPILQGFMDYGTVVNSQKLSDVKYKLKRLGVNVVISNI